MNRSLFRSPAPWRQWLALVLCAVAAGCGPENARHNHAALDLDGNAFDLPAQPAKVVVLIFVSNDCPISNRYTPEIRRLHERFAPRGTAFWLVHPFADETPAALRKHAEEFHYPCAVLRDPGHVLVKQAEATVVPEAAVFVTGGRLVYHGRIDDRFADFGKERVAATQHDLQEAIESALRGDAPRAASVPAIGCRIPPPK